MSRPPAGPDRRQSAVPGVPRQAPTHAWRRRLAALGVVALCGWAVAAPALAGEPSSDTARDRARDTARESAREPARGRARPRPATPDKPDTSSACPPEAQAPTDAQRLTAQRQARDRGFLWRVTRDGRSSWLYGTIHVGRQAWLALGPTLDRVLPETDVLALELDPTDPELIRRLGQPPDPAPVGQTTGRGEGDSSPTPDTTAQAQQRQQRLQRQIDAACIAPARLAPLHPVLQATALASLAGRRDGLDPAFGLEHILAGRARRQQRPIVSLETPELQLATLLHGDAATAAAMVDDLLTQLESGQLRRTLVRLATSWEAGRLDDLANYEAWCDCINSRDDRALLKRLNDDRNPALAAAIDAQHRQGRRVFAAVGALHMTGPQGLPGLMAAKGYRVVRVYYPN
jgi:uncharacterized protein YbaP (TraB family)